jgi:hypothetical protein
MRYLASIKKVPLFPVIPFVPAALFIGSLAASFSALARVRRLERRLSASPQ